MLLMQIIVVVVIIVAMLMFLMRVAQVHVCVCVCIKHSAYMHVSDEVLGTVSIREYRFIKPSVHLASRNVQKSDCVFVYMLPGY